MPRSRNEALRSALIEAAIQQFAEHGYGGCSMEAVGRAAGVSKGGVYFHFRSKEALFFVALDYQEASLRQETAAATDLRQFLVSYLRFQFENPQAATLQRLLSTELRGRFLTEVREDLRTAQRGLRGKIRELLAAGIQEGRLFATDVAYSAFVIACTIEGVLQQWASSPKETAPFLQVDALVDHLMGPFRTSGPGSTGASGGDGGASGDFLPLL